MLFALSAAAQTNVYVTNGVAHIPRPGQNANATDVFAIPLGMTQHQVTVTAPPSVTVLTTTVSASADDGTFNTVGTTAALGSTITFGGTYKSVKIVYTNFAGSGVVTADYWGNSAAATGVAGLPVVTAALSGTVVTVTSGPAVLDSFQCSNSDATNWAYVQVWDTAGVVTPGTTVAKQSYGLAPAGNGVLIGPTRPLQFFNAIKVAATTTATGATQAVTAVNCNWGTK